MNYIATCPRCGHSGELGHGHVCMVDVLSELRTVTQLLKELLAALKGQEGLIPGVAGESPCAGCGEGMDGAFQDLCKIRGQWYHKKCGVALSGGCS